MTFKIFLSVIVSALLTLGVLVVVYNAKSQYGSYYYMSNDIRQDLQLLELKSILGTILPPILAVELVGVTIAFIIGLISSRKIAVPIYKVEKWAHRLRNGKLNSQLAFRTEDRLEDLTSQCNGVTEFFRKTCQEISEHADAISYNPQNPEFVKEHAAAIKKILDKMEL
jgi:methyl-accepting chemotaxis protein